MNKENLECLLAFANVMDMMDKPFKEVYEAWKDAEEDYYAYQSTLQDPDLAAEEWEDIQWYDGAN